MFTDPSPDVRPAASTPALTIDSHGVPLLGVLHIPAGPGPHPVVVLLHGFPGNERNFDLAQALRRAGYAALVFHHRGSWGVGGSYSWGHVLEDAVAVVAAVRDLVFAAAHRLDPSRVALVGHSLGGFAALMTAAADPEIAAVASIAGLDFGAVDTASLSFDEDLLPLRGTSSEALVAEMRAAGDAWSLPGLAPRLAERPVLLVGTGLDTVTPVATHHEPVVGAYLAASVALEHRVFTTDHALSDHRVALARTLVDFLDRHLREPLHPFPR